MLVRLLGIMAGPGGVHNRGELIQVTEAEGQLLIDTRQAVAVDAEEVAKAKAASAENATSNAAETRETAEANPHRKRRVKVD